MSETLNILGIKVSNLDNSLLKEKISNAFAKNKLCLIATLNPEITLKAIHDEEYFFILNNFDLTPVDGIGLKFAGLLLGKNLKRITGVETSEIILEFCEKENKKVLIANYEEGLSAAEDIARAIQAKYPRLKFMIRDIARARKAWQEILTDTEIINFAPDVLFCSLGAPYQEKFIYHIAKKINTLKIAIGVGGAFDFFTGKIKRAPVFLRKAGFEWLWRLSKQPARWKRIIDAVIIFPFNFAKWRFLHPFLYRKNIACLLYKIENKQKYILLVEREDESGHWQLPQGGTDNESLKTAGARELREELNCADFKLEAVYKNLYAYKFGQRKESKNYLKNIKHYGYKGQKQSLCIAEFTGLDKNIKMNFWEHSAWQWVPLEKVLETVHACRKEATQIYLDYFLKFLG